MPNYEWGLATLAARTPPSLKVSGQTMPVKFPICRSGFEILNMASIAMPRASREGEARRLSGKSVAFVSEFVGPEFSTADAALDRFKGLVEDDRSESRFSPAIEDRFMAVVCRFRRNPGRPRKRKAGQDLVSEESKATLPSPYKVYYQLAVSYWKIADGRRPASQATLSAFSDKRSRRRAKVRFSAEDLAAIVNTPLRATGAQLAMDFGLFERQDPDKPGWYIADE